MRFDNRVAIVTGSGGGIGKGYVKRLASEGCKVVIAELDEVKGTEAQEEFRNLGYDVTFIKTDVANEENVKSTVEKTVELYGRIDILINNAQATRTDLNDVVAKTSTELMKLCWNTGCFATYLFEKYCLPYMVEQNYGRIINTASATGVTGMATFGAYGSNKEAIRGLTRITAQEYGKYGITCNVVCPAALSDAAKAWAEACPEAYAATVASYAIPRMGDIDNDLAPVVAFLASEEARYITAQTIGIDGGITKFE